MTSSLSLSRFGSGSIGDALHSSVLAGERPSWLRRAFPIEPTTPVYPKGAQLPNSFGLFSYSNFLRESWANPEFRK